MLTKIFVVIISLAFLAIGLLLLLNHQGLANKIANYLFFVILVMVISKAVSHKG